MQRNTDRLTAPSGTLIQSDYCLPLLCFVLSCLVLSCLALSLVLCCLVFSYLVWSCLVLSGLVLSCPVSVLSCLVLPSMVLPSMFLPSITLPRYAMPHALSCVALLPRPPLPCLDVAAVFVLPMSLKVCFSSRLYSIRSLSFMVVVLGSM
jgi:hypothetical protein